MLRRPLVSRTPWLMKSHARPPQNGWMCWPAWTRRGKRSRPVVQVPTRAPPARRLLKIVELGRQRAGRARLGEINRAVNLSIRATSDWSQYGVDDFWSTPLASLEKGAGDCEDYAILKYLALREAGVSPDDLRLLIVSYPRCRTMHAVLAVHWDEEWLLLDNLTMVMVNSLEATQYLPLIALDYQAMTTFAAGSPAPQEAPAAIQNISSVPKDLPSRSVAR